MKKWNLYNKFYDLFHEIQGKKVKNLFDSNIDEILENSWFISIIIKREKIFLIFMIKIIIYKKNW